MKPISDVWMLAHPKLKEGKKYYGAYPAGFPERARMLLPATLKDKVLHVCGGHARHYLYKRGFGPNDKTLDIDPLTEPDYCQDALDPIPRAGKWRGIIVDPPYDEKHAENYRCGPSVLPNVNKLLLNCINSVRVGGRVGFLHWVVPRVPKNAILIAEIAVIVGTNTRIRIYSVYERIEE